MTDKKTTRKEPTRNDIERFNKDVESFDEKMKKVRREYIQKSTNSKKSASELVLTS